MSRKTAINDMCKQCIYDGNAAGFGSWRQQCEDCSSDGKDGRSLCPLYPHRPLTLETTRLNAKPRKTGDIL